MSIIFRTHTTWYTREIKLITNIELRSKIFVRFSMGTPSQGQICGMQAYIQKLCNANVAPKSQAKDCDINLAASSAYRALSHIGCKQTAEILSYKTVKKGYLLYFRKNT
jgi:hypothetical protein